MNIIRRIRIKRLERTAARLDQQMQDHNEMLDDICRLNPYECAVKQASYYEAKRRFVEISKRIFALKNGL